MFKHVINLKALLVFCLLRKKKLIWITMTDSWTCLGIYIRNQRVITKIIQMCVL